MPDTRVCCRSGDSCGSYISSKSFVFRLRDWLSREAPLANSAVARAEFPCGPLDAHDLSLAAAVVGEAVPLTADHAVQAAELFNAAGRKRGTFVDCLIAAVAMQKDAELATANPADFKGMPGLRIAG